MVEIDLVRRAIESFKPYDVTDEISDTYWKVVDIATTPSPTADQLAAYYACRQVLLEEHVPIMECLRAKDDCFPEGPVSGAYISALEQIDGLMSTCNK